jgi:hypothetical protein
VGRTTVQAVDRAIREANLGLNPIVRATPPHPILSSMPNAAGVGRAQIRRAGPHRRGMSAATGLTISKKDEKGGP